MQAKNHLFSIEQRPPYTLQWCTIDKYQSQIDWQGQKIHCDTPLLPGLINTNFEKNLIIALPAPLNLLVCGASPDVPPVVAIAAHLGWKTTVIDHRQELIELTRFPGAEAVTLVKRKAWSDFHLDSFDAAVIMSHQYERDKDYLSQLIGSKIPYLGLLGPRKRRDQLLNECVYYLKMSKDECLGQLDWTLEQIPQNQLPWLLSRRSKRFVRASRLDLAIRILVVNERQSAD